jgi:D-amino-acid oxidase
VREPERRRFLRSSVAAAGALAAGCAPVRPSSPPERRFGLPPVVVAEDRVIRTVVGLRPFRPSGFVVRAEALGPKTLVHDYGHGGAGVTLSWGTAQLAIEASGIATGARAAVLGCGAVGLATARLLQRRGVAVTIYARELPPETTSNVAGAHWSPFFVADKDKRTPAFDQLFERAARLSYRAFQDLVGERYAVRWLDTYALFEQPPPDNNGPLRDLFPGVTLLGPGEHPFPAPFVRRSRSMLIEPSTYLAALVTDFELAGGAIVVRALATAADVVALPEPFVFNCTGLGAAALFGDPELLPVRGQLSILVPQPEVTYIAEKDDLYMFPRADGIVLGGTRERGVSSLEVNAESARTIIAREHALFAAMRP